MHACSNTPKVLSPCKISDPCQILNPHKKLIYPHQIFLDPCNPDNQCKFRPMPPTQLASSRNPRNLADSHLLYQSIDVIQNFVMQNSVRHCASSKLLKSKESNFQYYIIEKEKSVSSIKSPAYA